jgi:hypothetical protein
LDLFFAHARPQASPARRVATPHTPIKAERTWLDLFSARVHPQASPARRVATPLPPIKDKRTWLDLFPRAFALDPGEWP